MKKMMNRIIILRSLAPKEPNLDRSVSWLTNRIRGAQDRRKAMSESHTTTNHDVIRKWVSERNGVPATVKATEEDGHAGILRIDFDPKETSLEQIDWDEFFRKFDESGLAF